MIAERAPQSLAVSGIGGGAAYQGEWIARPELGQGPAPAQGDRGWALTVYRRACILLWLGVGRLAWQR